MFLKTLHIIIDTYTLPRMVANVIHGVHPITLQSSTRAEQLSDTEILTLKTHQVVATCSLRRAAMSMQCQ